jgi:hypothetical protein
MNLVHLANPVNPVKSSLCCRVLCGICLRLFHTFITTNGDFFTGHGYFDPAIIDRPITDRTFARVHEFVSLVQIIFTNGDRLPASQKPDFQNLAYFRRISDGDLPNSRRNASLK